VAASGVARRGQQVCPQPSISSGKERLGGALWRRVILPVVQALNRPTPQKDDDGDGHGLEQLEAKRQITGWLSGIFVPTTPR